MDSAQGRHSSPTGNNCARRSASSRPLRQHKQVNERRSRKPASGKPATAAELARLRQLQHAVANSLQPQLQALASTTGTLTHDTSALKSEIAALRAYLRSASPAGADSGFLDAQIKYLVASTESANAAASTLEQETQHAQVAAAKLGKTTH